MSTTLRPLRIVWLLPVVLYCSPLLAGQQSDQRMVRHYTQQARQALAEKDTHRAAAALEALARLTPNNPQVEANLGTVYYVQGRYKPAAERFRRALQENPEIPNVRPLLGICYAELGRSQKAIPLLAPAFQHPPNPGVGRLIGIELLNAYHSLNRNFDALEVSEELLKRYPDDPEVLYRAGRFYGDRALEIMRQLVKAAPNSPWERMAFAEALEGEKRYSLAILEYRKVIASDPQIPGVHYRLGRAILLDSLDSKEAQNAAMEEFRKALVADPRNASAEYEIGQIYRRRGQVKEAANYFSLAITISPHRADGQIALAQALIALHRPKEALPHLRIAARLNPESGAAHFLLAEIYRSEGDSQDYRREMALYQKYHVQPFAEESSGEH